MTPREAANQATANNLHISKEFLLTASAREIQEFIHNVAATDYNQSFHHARTALEIRLAEDAANTAQKLLEVVNTQKKLAEEASKQGDRLIKLTWVLAIVSAGLLVFAIVQTAIMFRQNAEANTQRIQAGQH